MSDALDVLEEDRTEDEVRPTILPPPTLPAALSADDAGDEDVVFVPAGGVTSAEAPDNKKPYLLVRLGHRLCGFR